MKKWKLWDLTHSLPLSKSFILVRVAVDLESSPGTLRMTWVMVGITRQHAHTHTFTLRGNFA